MSSYVGVEPRSNNGLRDYFAGNGVLTSFTLSSVPGGANGIIVAISGAIQKPGVSYFVSGKTLTFSEAPPSPFTGEVNNIEVIYLQRLGVAQSVKWRVPIANNTGTSDVITAAYSPINSALTDNLMLYVVLTSANTTSTPSFNPDNLSPKVVVEIDGSPVTIGRLRGTVLLRYSASLDSWFVVSGGISGSLSVVTASTSSQLALAGFHYVLTNNITSTLTLPASPSLGDTIWVTFTNGLTNNVISCNGQTIMGKAEDMIIDNVNATIELRFINSTWRLV